MNDNRFGRCRRKSDEYNGKYIYDTLFSNNLRGSYEMVPFCFVIQPSTCPDLMDSVIDEGRQISAEACKEDPNSLGK